MPRLGLGFGFGLGLGLSLTLTLTLALTLALALTLTLTLTLNPNPGVSSGSLARVLSYGGLVLATAIGVASHPERAAILESLSQVSWT